MASSHLTSPLIVRRGLTSVSVAQLSFLVNEDNGTHEVPATNVHTLELLNAFTKKWKSNGGRLVDLRSDEANISLKEIEARLNAH